MALPNDEDGNVSFLKKQADVSDETNQLDIRKGDFPSSSDELWNQQISVVTGSNIGRESLNYSFGRQENDPLPVNSTKELLKLKNSPRPKRLLKRRERNAQIKKREFDVCFLESEDDSDKENSSDSYLTFGKCRAKRFKRTESEEETKASQKQKGSDAKEEDLDLPLLFLRMVRIKDDSDENSSDSFTVFEKSNRKGFSEVELEEETQTLLKSQFSDANILVKEEPKQPCRRYEQNDSSPAKTTKRSPKLERSPRPKRLLTKKERDAKVKLRFEYDSDEENSSDSYVAFGKYGTQRFRKTKIIEEKMKICQTQQSDANILAKEEPDIKTEDRLRRNGENRSPIQSKMESPKLEDSPRPRRSLKRKERDVGAESREFDIEDDSHDENSGDFCAIFDKLGVKRFRKIESQEETNISLNQRVSDGKRPDTPRPKRILKRKERDAETKQCEFNIKDDFDENSAHDAQKLMKIRVTENVKLLSRKISEKQPIGDGIMLVMKEIVQVLNRGDEYLIRIRECINREHDMVNKYKNEMDRLKKFVYELNSEEAHAVYFEKQLNFRAKLKMHTMRLMSFEIEYERTLLVKKQVHVDDETNRMVYQVSPLSSSDSFRNTETSLVARNSACRKSLNDDFERQENHPSLVKSTKGLFKLKDSLRPKSLLKRRYRNDTVEKHEEHSNEENFKVSSAAFGESGGERFGKSELPETTSSSPKQLVSDANVSVKEKMVRVTDRSDEYLNKMRQCINYEQTMVKKYKNEMHRLNRSEIDRLHPEKANPESLKKYLDLRVKLKTHTFRQMSFEIEYSSMIYEIRCRKYLESKREHNWLSYEIRYRKYVEDKKRPGE